MNALLLILLALEPRLVKDINPVPSPAGSGPAAFAAVGDLAVFEASDGGDRVLWTSDGTAEGTRVLADTDAVEPLVRTGDRLFFLGRQSLWVTDGRTAQRLTGPLAVEEAVWVAAQGVLYFSADGGLWRTDGTPGGTRRFSASASQLTAYRGRLWFIRGRSLWRTDGTTVERVRKLFREPRILGGVGKHLLVSEGDELFGLPVLDSVVQGGRLWFVAETDKGQELWVSDGTGARQLTRFSRKQAFFAPSELLYLGLPRSSPDRFVFAAHDGVHGPEVWVSDGTPAGTRLLRDLCPGPCAGIESFHLDGLYLTGNDGIHGRELWSTDGTRIELVRDVCPGPCGSDPGSLVVLGDRLLFTADDGSGVELWTAEGRVSDFEPRAPWVSFHGAALPGTLLFAADDGEHGLELWATDGTTTRLVRDLDDSNVGGSFPHAFSALGDTAFFFADDGVHGYELWKSDGIETSLVAELIPGEEPPEVLGSAAVGNELFLSFEGALWRTGGTAVQKVAEVEARELTSFQGDLWYVADGGLWRDGVRVPGPSNPHLLTGHAGRLWFFDDAGLWNSDGLQEEGRVGSLLASLGEDLIVSDHRGLWSGTRILGPPADPGTPWTVFQGRLYYTSGNRLWATGRGPVGAPGAFSFATLGDRLFFVTGEAGIPLWVTDGTEAVKVRNLIPGFIGGVELLTVGPRVFLPAHAPDTGIELWTLEEE